MSQTDKGVLIFYEWFEAMDTLSPKCYKALMTAIFRYQLNGEKIPEFKGNSAILAAVIFPCLRRRLDSARGGKRTMQTRYGLDESSAALQEIIQRKVRENQASG